MYQGKQTPVSGRKTVFVPELLRVQIEYLCLGTGCVGRDRSNFICLTFTNCYKSVRNLVWVLVSEDGTTAEFKEFLPGALCCRLVPRQQDFPKLIYQVLHHKTSLKKVYPQPTLRFPYNRDVNKAEYFHAHFLNSEIVHFSVTCSNFYTNSS